ncbi:dipeptidyl aminopeptidase/acylaminoacyl peptidase [Fontibacillus solani]|uniref:Dipeptidyl aminopeptidase/acylaminoacyl peptidase n=1 Tax=Fontibacillus solani TaxID=1572857 RepID=A0A7W3SQB4_9BACL|nr:S9 family peptidase [Fontibacillus solani]MBA9084285.1 dipeptidyl aminopeptidase/acylaminoacyl peptidase [Fontibacillus solani]
MANKRPLVPRDLYEYQWVSQPSIGFQGAVAYVKQTIDQKNNDYVTQIRVVSLDGGDDRRLTDGEHDSAPSWSPGGKLLAFLRASEGIKQLYTTTVEDSSEKSDPDTVKHTDLARGVDNYVWSPDGSFIAFTSRVEWNEGEAADGKQESKDLRGRVYERTTPKAEGSGWWDGLHSHLFVLELKSGRITRLTWGYWDAAAPVWSPDGEFISFITKQVKEQELDADLLHFADIYTIKRSGGEPVKITSSSLLITQFAYSPEGQRLALIASDRVYGSSSHNRLYTVPAAGGNPELIAPELDVQLGNSALGDMKPAGSGQSLLYDYNNPQLGVYVLGTRDGNVHVYRIDETRNFDRITEGEEKDIYQYTLSPDGRYFVVVALTAERPGELYRVDVRTGEELRLTRHNDEFFAGLQILTPERIAFQASDGIAIHGWLLKPFNLTQSEPVKVPLVLMIHGGPHAMYTGVFSHELQTLAAQGYAVVWVNPRGSMGYGQDFVKACRGDFGGGDARDLLEAVDYVLSEFDFVDTTRLGVGGGSYGGVMTNWLVSHTDRFRAAFTHRSISNWLSLYGTSDVGISFTEDVIGGNLKDDAEMLWSKSPLAHAHRIEIPLLILHGEDDYRTPISQAEELYSVLKRYGKTTKLIRYPGSNHSMLKSGKPSLRVDSFEQVNAWFGQYLHGD